MRADRRDNRLVRAVRGGARERSRGRFAPGAFDWIGLALIAIVLPAVLSWLFNAVLRKLGWVRDGDMKLS